MHTEPFSIVSEVAHDVLIFYQTVFNLLPIFVVSRSNHVQDLRGYWLNLINEVVSSFPIILKHDYIKHRSKYISLFTSFRSYARSPQ